MFLEKVVLKICSKFTGEHPCRSVISVKLQSKFYEISLWHGCSPVNLPHIFRTPFPKNTSGGSFRSRKIIDSYLSNLCNDFSLLYRNLVTVARKKRYHFLSSFPSEAVAQRCSVKKLFLEISQNSQENIYVRISFLLKLRPATLLKKRL